MGENQSAVGSTAPNDEKHAVLADIANKIQALDNSVKLNILSLLVEAGSLSITDIAKKLDINFSTAHKYLEQLEGADLVASKQVADNRLKRIFTIQDFNIELSPKALFKKSTESNNHKEKSKFKVFDTSGQLVDFDEEEFSQKYLKRGMPRGTILLALQEIMSKAYTGITLAELRRLFRHAVEQKAENINVVLAQMDHDLYNKKTCARVLGPEALKQHETGDIFIRQLDEPKLLNFTHDTRGISVHGMKGKKITNLQELLANSLVAAAKIREFTKIQSFDSLNYCLAPFVKSLSKQEIATMLTDFFNKLKETGIKTTIAIDLGVPKFASTVSSSYSADEEGQTYAKFADIAAQLAEEIIKIFKTTQSFNLVIKLWNKADTNLIKDLENVYIADLRPEWQGVNASFICSNSVARFDSAWKSWMGTQRTGEIQDITINLPRLALKTKSEVKFLEELKKTINYTIEYLYTIAELAIGEFFRKYDTFFESVQQGRWNYIPIENCAYAISLTGLNEAVSILSGESLGDNIKLGEKILKTCNKCMIDNVKTPLRIVLKENRDEDITTRFRNLDSIAFKSEVPKKYTPGLACENLSVCSLHKNLTGGHCATMTKTEFQNSAKSAFGLVFITK